MAVAMVAVIVFFAVAFIAATVVVMAVISVSVSVVPVPMVPVVSISVGFRSMIFVLMVVAPAIVIVIFSSGVVFMAFLTPLLSGVFLMAFLAAFLVTLMGAIGHFMTMVLMLPDIMMLRIVTDGIRMVILVAVYPSPLPRSVVDEDHAAVPGNPVIAPTPGPEGDSHANAETEADCRSNKESRTRTRIHNDWIVGRNNNVVDARRHDRDIRAARHHNLRTAAQISIVARALPHSLHRIHHFLLLAQKSVANIGGPAHVGSHHLQHVGKGKQCLHGRVPGQLVTFNGRRQLAAAEIVVRVGPGCGVGYVVGKRGCR